MSLFDDIARQVANGLTETGGTVARGGGGLLGETIGRNVIGAVKNNIPAKMGPVVNAGVGAAVRVAQGDVGGALRGVLDSGVLHTLQPQTSGFLSTALFLGTPNPLFGGITPLEAKEIYAQCQAERYAKQNLFLVEVEPLMWSVHDMVPAQKFNLFATAVSYSPYTVTGDRVRVGASSVDIPQEGQHVTMSITTLDDQYGTLKRWMGYRSALTAHADGTVGLPVEYLLKIRVAHAFVTAETARNAFDGGSGMYRPANLECSLSRRDDALEELQMQFEQFDPFCPVK